MNGAFIALAACLLALGGAACGNGAPGGQTSGGSNGGAAGRAGAGAMPGGAAGHATAGSGGVAGTSSPTGGAAGVAGTGGVSGGAAGPGGAAGGAPGGAAGGAAGTSAEDPSSVDVYLIGGQSNADGQGYSKNLPSGFTIDTRVQIYYSADKNQGVQARTWIPNCAASGGVDFCNLGATFGPELGFGNAIQAFYPSRRIALIKHSKSGTNLYSQWAPGSSPTDTGHFGPEFTTFVNTVTGGLEALKSRGLHPVLRGMLWQQGEADADAGGQNYGPNLQAFIRRVREQWTAPDMLFIYGYVYPVAAAASNRTGRDVVRAAEKDVDQDSGAALATRRAFVVETDGLEMRAQDPNVCGIVANDQIHFGTAGQLELGKRMAVKVHDEL